MKKILKSLMMIGGVIALVTGLSLAFLSDRENSTDNLFQVGEIDLKVGNDCYYNKTPDGTPNCYEATDELKTSWAATDLGVAHKFFYFPDIKPSDFGEDTISLKVINNDAWGVMEMANISDQENNCNEPESLIEGETCNTDGEVLDNLKFWLWLDQGLTPGFQNENREPGDPSYDFGEGDNLQSSKEPSYLVSATLTNEGLKINLWEWLSELYNSWDAGGCYSYSQVPDQWGRQASVDGNTNYGYCHGLASDGRLVGNTTYYFGIKWLMPETTGNEIQSDRLTADLNFNVVQHRGNPDRTGLSHAPIDPENGLIAYWKFDETDGDAIVSDSSGEGNDGKAIDGAQRVAGKIGSALTFNGNNYVKIPYSKSLDLGSYDNLSIEFWVNRSGGDWDYFFSQPTTVSESSQILRHELWFWYGNTEFAGSLINAGDFRFVNISANIWHHVVITADNTEIKVYLDGSLARTSSKLGDLASADARFPTVLGTRLYINSNGTYNTGGSLNGMLDEFKVYSRALTSAEVQAHYLAQ